MDDKGITIKGINDKSMEAKGVKARSIMIQGTASSVGKSIVTAGLCRVFKQDGCKVAPFKSQNLALNSFITRDGKEMGRAQVVQAEAAGVEPKVTMNPVLIKPTAGRKPQIIVNGEVLKDMSADEYHNFKPELSGIVGKAYNELAAECDIVVIEGAGSPVEINLRDRDIVNMGMAEIADAPVILVGDIDKGGVFAALAGTMLLFTEAERSRVKGVIINKFRGDLELLKPGLGMLEEIIHVPVLGVLPYTDLDIDDEDSLAERFERLGHGGSDHIGQDDKRKDVIDVAVIKLPHISNFTDFNVLEHIDGVRVRYIEQAKEIQQPDLIIIPGTKYTIGDLMHIRENGIEAEIKRLNETGTVVFGICGGFQMLGKEISDPCKVESGLPEVEGMGLLDTKTTFAREKAMTQSEGTIIEDEGILRGLEGMEIRGYEIHMGATEHREGCIPFLTLEKVLDESVHLTGGVRNTAGNVFGTYIHGVFDNIEFASGFLNNIREYGGSIGESEGTGAAAGRTTERYMPEAVRESRNIVDYKEYKEQQYDKLAGLIRQNLDMDRIYDIIGLNPTI